MKKVIYLLVLSILFSISSCNKEDDSFIAENQIEDNFLRFSTVEEMEEKIEVFTIQNNKKESLILEKILIKNNLEAPNSNTLNKNGNLKWEDIKDDIQFYHNEKLNAIYELRKEHEFTSIKSIADEINF